MKPKIITINSLTTEEFSKLAKLETTIKDGLKTFADVGNALMAIRDCKLYRTEFSTFEKYCAEKWKMNQSRAYQFIDSANVIKQLETSTIVELPKNEAQTRPLSQLPAQEQAPAWEAANEKAKEENRDTEKIR